MTGHVWQESGYRARVWLAIEATGTAGAVRADLLLALDNEIPPKTLSPILHQLRTAGLVEATRDSFGAPHYRYRVTKDCVRPTILPDRESVQHVRRAFRNTERELKELPAAWPAPVSSIFDLGRRCALEAQA